MRIGAYVLSGLFVGVLAGCVIEKAPDVAARAPQGSSAAPVGSTPSPSAAPAAAPAPLGSSAVRP